MKIERFQLNERMGTLRCEKTIDSKCSFCGEPITFAIVKAINFNKKYLYHKNLQCSFIANDSLRVQSYDLIKVNREKNKIHQCSRIAMRKMPCLW